MQELAAGARVAVLTKTFFITFWPLEQVLTETERNKDGTSAVTQWRVRILQEVEPILPR